CLDHRDEPSGNREARGHAERQATAGVHDRRDLDVEKEPLSPFFYSKPDYPSLHAHSEVRLSLVDGELGSLPRALGRVVKAHGLGLHPRGEVDLLEMGATKEILEDLPDASHLRPIPRTDRDEGS